MLGHAAALTVSLGCPASCVDRAHEQADGESGEMDTGRDDEDTGRGSGSDASCPADALTCEFDGAWDLAVGHTKVYWIAGSTSPTCPRGAPCGTPRLLSLDLDADGSPQSIELPDSPTVVVAVGPDDVAVVGTESGVLLVEPGAAPRTIATNRLTSLVVGGDEVFWADRDGPSIARHNWTTGWDQPPIPVFASDGPAIEMLRIDAQTLAWAEYPTPGRGALRVLPLDDPMPATIVEDVGLVTDLAIEADALYWVDADGSLQTVPMAGAMTPRILRSDVGSIGVAAGRVWLGWLDLSSARAGLDVLDPSSGSATSLHSDDYEVGQRTPYVWDVSRGRVVWSDAVLHASAFE